MSNDPWGICGSVDVSSTEGRAGESTSPASATLGRTSACAVPVGPAKPATSAPPVTTRRTPRRKTKRMGTPGSRRRGGRRRLDSGCPDHARRVRSGTSAERETRERAHAEFTLGFILTGGLRVLDRRHADVSAMTRRVGVERALRRPTTTEPRRGRPQRRRSHTIFRQMILTKGDEQRG